MNRIRLVLLGAIGLILVGVGIVALVGSGDDDGGSCTELADPLDPGSLQHVLPDSPPPSYVTDPPTSGPHQAGRLGGGVLTEPVPRPVQVGALEAGQVLIQHLPSVDIKKLVPLAGDDVVIAPNPTLPAPIVATAWRHTLRCPSDDVARLRTFITAYATGQEQHP